MEPTRERRFSRRRCRIRELTSLVQKRFGFTEGTVRCLSPAFLPPPPPPLSSAMQPLILCIYQFELYAERVNNRGLSACSQAESLKFKLVQVALQILTRAQTHFTPIDAATCCILTLLSLSGPRYSPRLLQRFALHHGERRQGCSGAFRGPDIRLKSLRFPRITA